MTITIHLQNNFHSEMYNSTNQQNIIGSAHNCQYLNECTKHIFSDIPPPSKNCTHQHFSNG